MCKGRSCFAGLYETECVRAGQNHADERKRQNRQKIFNSQLSKFEIKDEYNDRRKNY